MDHDPDKNGWLPIESAPDDGRGVILIDMTAQKPEAGIGFFIFGFWSAIDPDGEPAFEEEFYRSMVWVSPTHWQPLPEPPSHD